MILLYFPVVIIDDITGAQYIDNAYVGTFISVTSEILTILHAKKYVEFKTDEVSIRISFKLVISILILTIGFKILVSQIIDSIQIYLYPFNSSGSNNDNNIIHLLDAIICAPILEELLFRKIILTGYLKNYNKFISVIVSSLLFALLHLHPTSIISAFIGGLFFAYLYIATKSVIPGILAHSFGNAMNHLPFLLFKIQIPGFNSLDNTITNQPLWFNILGIIFTIIGCFIFIKIIREFKSAEQEKVR